MKKQIRNLAYRNTIFSSSILYQDFGFRNKSNWSFVLNLPSVRKELDKIAACMEKSLFGKQHYCESPIFMNIGSLRFTFQTTEINNTIIELKIYK